MFNEKKFHELIEQQDPEEKEKSWAKIESRLSNQSEYETSEVVNNGSSMALIKNKKFIIPFIGVLVLALIATLTLSLIFTNRPKDDSPIRFCTIDDFTIVDSTQTLKEYSKEFNRDWLFFDWYDETDFCSDSMYKLNATGEDICFSESIMDMETGYIVTIFITDNKTEIDTLENFKLCENDFLYNDITIKWGGGSFSSLATFEYNGNIYYLKIDQSDGAGTVLSYVESLLS